MGDAAQQLRSVLRPVVEEKGLFLEALTVGAAGRRRLVRVTVDLPDGPGGVGSDALTDVSHAVSAALDAADVIDGTYVLEVSTPGTDRPLREPRHFRRAMGRLVHARTASGERIRGRIVAGDGEGVVFDVDGERRHVAYGDLVEGSIELELTAIEELEG